MNPLFSFIIKLFVLPLFFLLYTSFNVNMKNRQKTMLVVVAHPDDEMAVAEVLVKFNRQGFKVILMIATDGKYGTRVTQIPEGDSLGKVRREESICSSEKMGIEHPIFLSIDRNYFYLLNRRKSCACTRRDPRSGSCRTAACAPCTRSGRAGSASGGRRADIPWART